MENEMPSFSGLIRMKKDLPIIAPERFNQLKTVYLNPYTLLKMEVLGYAVPSEVYWVICKLAEGKYVKIPFAKNRQWFEALTSEVAFAFVAKLPQIYVT